MKKLISLIVLSVVWAFGLAQSQFPGTDSLRNFNNRFITNNASQAFTNLRLHNLLDGIIDFLGSGPGTAGVDTLFAPNDTTIRYRKDGVFRQFTVKGAYDNRSKVDTLYKVNDTTIGFTVNHVSKILVFPSGLSQNIANATLIANGDYVHDWVNHWLFINNIKSFEVNQNLPDPNLINNTKVFRFYLDSTYNSTAMQLAWGLKDQSNSSTDSLHFEINSSKDASYITHWVDGQGKLTELDFLPTPTFPSININVSGNSHSGFYQFGAGTAIIQPNDSVRLRAVAVTTPPVKMLGFRSLGFGNTGTVVSYDKQADTNYFNTNLNLTGDRTHNGYGHGVLFDSVSYHTVMSRGSSLNKLQRTFITVVAGLGFPIWMGNIIRDTANTRDSINQSFTFQNSFVQIGSQNIGLPSSYITLGHGVSSKKSYIELLTDSLIAQLAVKTTGLDTVVIVGEYNPTTGTNRLYKSPTSSFGSSQTWQQTLTTGSTLTSDNVVNLDGKNLSMVNGNTSGGGFLSTKFNDGAITYKIVAKDDPGSTDSSYLTVDATAQVARVVNESGNFTSNVTAAQGTASTNAIYANGTLLSRSISVNDTTQIKLVSERLISSVIQKGNEIHLYKDSIVVNPEISTDNLLLWIKQLPASSSSSDSVLVQTADGQVKKRAQSDVGGGGGGSTPVSFFQIADATVSATTTETTLIGSGTGTLTIPANNLVAGKTYRLTIRGKYSTSATNPANFNFRWYVGSTQILGSIAGVGTNKTDETFDIHSDFTCRTTGSSGTVMAQGMFFTQDGPGAHGYAPTLTTINTTISNTMDFTVEMNDGSAGNTVTIYILTIEEINP